MNTSDIPPRQPAIEIRPADLTCPAERTAVARLLAEYAAALHSVLAESPERVVERLHDDGRALVWLAWEGESACGLAICFRLFSTFTARPTINIHDVAVSATHRGRGIGTRLIETVAQTAITLGCGKLTLEVRSDNPAAERLYRRVGFTDPAGVPTRFLDRPIVSRPLADN